MKKSAILSLACAALMSAGSAFAAVPEIVYVEDEAQGYTFNRFKDNWFLTVDGGVNVVFGKADKVLPFKDRIASPAFDLQVGKWFSPILGLRAGATYLGERGASKSIEAFGLTKDANGYQMYDGYYKTHIGQLGANLDVMLNVTNWWCGYKPNRVYNFIAYVGGGAYLGFEHKFNNNGNDGWSKSFDTSLALRGGIINSFNVSKQVALSLDLRYTAHSSNQEVEPYNLHTNDVAALIGVTYLFNKRTWNAPIVPVIPVIEDCDPIKARLAECEGRLQDTQRKLDECLRRPMPKAPEAAPCIQSLATTYYRIGSATVSATDRNVLKSVASTIKESGKKYVVTGWADNYTGTDAVNARLRTRRAENVKKILVANGVNADQLIVTTNSGDRFGGKANVYLDRCVTIEPEK